MPPGTQDDDAALTLRAPRFGVALIVALGTHVLAWALLGLLPEPKPPPQRIAITLQRSAPPPPPTSTSPRPSAAAPSAPARPRPPSKAPPQTSSVAPELAPSESPPENRAQLPMVETSPLPAPPPVPAQSWEERVLESLRQTAPKAPSGVLEPSFAALDRVAANDARLHDEANERRLQADHGPFFRRGLEALRGHWHPDEVLKGQERAQTRRCARQTRTTSAVAVIDRSGNVVSVDLKTSSGCPELDEEAVGAFLRVAQFPHPPEGLFVNPDGTPAKTARYPVRFIVSFDGGLRLDW